VRFVSGAVLCRGLMTIAFVAGMCAASIPVVRAGPSSARPPASPIPGLSQDVLLRSVSSDSPTDAWAVGSVTPSRHERSALILHWNGTTWSREDVSIPDSTDSGLNSVSAVSPTDVWAVGYYRRMHQHRYGLILHWNGTAWTQYGRSAWDELTSVSADSPTDAWAVGGPTGLQTLHWNGIAWSQIHKHAAPPESVDATSPTDAWAVGLLDSRTVIDHWNGRRWSEVRSPHSRLGHWYLLGVSADSPIDAWAVGMVEIGEGGNTFAVHWDGTRWSKTRTPSPSTTDQSVLFSVSADSPTDAWAVGYFGNPRGIQRALVLHWNGAAWSRVRLPGGYAVSVSAVSSADAWIVGGSKIFHWDGTSWSRE